MTRFQSIFLLLNLPPLEAVFSRIHDLGVRRVVTALSRHPAVFCILGSDSFFEKGAARWFSPVDLIIVLNEGIDRADAASGEIAHIYRQVRRIFPFLGPWREKETNLLFLSDLAAGFPAPESFRLRFKQGRLVPLYGKLPAGISGGTVTIGELLSELNSLLRFSLVADPRRARRLVFWKRMFTRLSACAELLDLDNYAEETLRRAELNFLAEGETRLFFRKGDPDRLFALQLALTRRIFDTVANREPKVKVRPVARVTGQAPLPGPMPFPSVLDPPNDERFSIRNIPSVPIGCTPRFLHFPIDERIPLLEIHHGAYDGLQRLRRTKPRNPVSNENALISAGGFLFIATRQATLVDLIPLDPLQFGNVYAAAFGDSLEFEMPASILAEQQATASAMFRGLAHNYSVNDGLVTKFSYPCIFREHDAEVIESALRMLRVRVAWEPERILIQRSNDLFEYLRERYPECAQFLSKLEGYQGSLRSGSPLGYATANNSYRCLQQFMCQVLEDAPTITLDRPQKHLGITVGVITRNRSGDLAEMLESLTRQMRPPDEVLLVDNGSTDDTQAVIDTFRDRLPIRYQFLKQAGIPGARNLVIETAAHEIVSFIDDDCVTEPDWLAAVETAFLRADNIGIVGGWVTHQPAPYRSTVENYYRVFHHIKS